MFKGKINEDNLNDEKIAAYNNQYVANSRNSRVAGSFKCIDIAQKSQDANTVGMTVTSPFEVTANDLNHSTTRVNEYLSNMNNKEPPNNVSTTTINTEKFNSELEKKKQLLNSKLLEIKQKKMNEEAHFPSILSRIKEVQSHFEVNNQDANSFTEQANNHSSKNKVFAELQDIPVIHKKKKKPAQFIE